MSENEKDKYISRADVKPISTAHYLYMVFHTQHEQQFIEFYAGEHCYSEQDIAYIKYVYNGKELSNDIDNYIKGATIVRDVGKRILDEAFEKIEKLRLQKQGLTYAFVEEYDNLIKKLEKCKC